MVRFMVLYDPPADPEAFERHYRDVHIPLVRALPGLRGYTISRGVTGVRGEPLHLVAELDWDDAASLQAAFASPAGQAASADVPKFAPEGTVRSMVFEVEGVV